MNSGDVVEVLSRHRIPPNRYGIFQPPTGHEGLMLDQENGIWTIVHFERGTPTEVGHWPNEEDAVKEFVKRLVKGFSW